MDISIEEIMKLANATVFGVRSSGKVNVHACPYAAPAHLARLHAYIPM